MFDIAVTNSQENKQLTQVLAMSLGGSMKGIAMKEIWKDIPGYENKYQISNYGQVRSLARIIDKTINGSAYKSLIKGRIMKSQVNLWGYETIQFNKNGGHEKFFVHRLVSTAFIPNPEGKPFVNHKDFNRLNNNVDNLEWVTFRENMDYSLKANRFINPKRRFNKQQVLEIFTSDKSCKELSKIYEIDESQISRIKNKKAYGWAHKESKE